MSYYEENFKTLCWKCEKSCNSNKCKWVKNCHLLSGLRDLTKEETLKYMPKGIELDEKKNVIKCPNFVHDRFSYTLKEKAEKQNLTIEQYKNKKTHIKEIIKRMFLLTEDDFNLKFDYILLENYINEILEDKSKFYKNLINFYLVNKNYTTTANKFEISKQFLKTIIKEFITSLKNRIVKDYEELKEFSSQSEEPTIKPIKVKESTARQQEIEQKRIIREQKQKQKLNEMNLKQIVREEKGKLKQSDYEIKHALILRKEQKQELLQISDLQKREKLKNMYLFLYNLDYQIFGYSCRPFNSLIEIENRAKELKRCCETIENEDKKSKYLKNLEEIKIKKIILFKEHEILLKELEERKKRKKTNRNLKKE